MLALVCVVWVSTQALKAVPPLHPGQSQYEEHWRRWIPKFDMMGYLHATRMRERHRHRMAQAATKVKAPDASAEGDTADGGLDIGVPVDATCDQRSSGTSSGGSGAEDSGEGGDGGGGGRGAWAGADDGNRRVREGVVRSVSDVAGGAGGTTNGPARRPPMLSFHRKQCSRGHIRVPAEFLAERAAQFQLRPSSAPLLSPTPGEAGAAGAAVGTASEGDSPHTPAPPPLYSYTEEKMTPLESLPEPIPLPSLPLRHTLAAAVPHFLNSRTFANTYGEVHMRFA